MVRTFLTSFLLLPLFAISQFANVLVGDSLNPNEPSIMINPNNPSEVIGAANLSNLYLSSDSGFTWTQQKVTSTLGVWGDPVMAIDTAGDYYYFHLSNPQAGSWIDRIVCQKSTDKGLTWNDGSYVGLNGTKQQDKQWVTIDRSNNYIYMTWTEFDSYASVSVSDKSRILFTKSIDAGATWSNPIQISSQEGDCIDSDNTTEGAVPTLGPNGEIYVAWAIDNKIVFNKSVDQGVTWLPTEVEIATQPGGWDYSIPGIGRCNGLPITVCDTSNSVNNGTIYVSWTDQKNGTSDTDVWIIKSTDEGTTWTNPKRINDDISGKHQFLTWLAVDQRTGNLYSVFYDRRNYTDEQTDVYLAYSEDGGDSFTNVKISESPFIPSPLLFFGDYTVIVAQNGMVRPIWARMNNGQQTIHTAIIQFDAVTGLQMIEPSNEISLEQNFPNPVQETTQIGFKMRTSGKISITVYDMFGRVVLTPITNQHFSYGRHEFTIHISDEFTSGMYYYQLRSNKESITRKMIVE